MPNPHDTPELYESLILGGRKSPGQVTLSGHDRDPDWDIKAAKGQDGASTSLNGQPIGQFQASFYLVNDPSKSLQEIEDWDSFQALIESTTNGTGPKALPVYHPDLARNHFTEVTNAGVSGMIHDGVGGAIVIVKFIEYKPPKKKPVKKAKGKAGAGTTGSSSAAGGNQPPKPDPNQAAKDELAALLTEAKTPL